MKTVCIYHSVDLDGWMSAAIVKLAHMGDIKSEKLHTNIDFIGYNYGQPIPDLSEYDKVIICDVSFPKDDMRQLFESGRLIYIDHHISAIKDNAYAIDIIQCERNTSSFHVNPKFAACELTWNYFFPKEIMPEIVRLLGMYDSFRHKGTNEELKVLEFQYGARQCISNYEEAYTELLYSLQNYPITSELVIHEQGKSIYQYLCTEAKQIYKNGFDIYFTLNKSIEDIDELMSSTDEYHDVQYKFICINRERFNPSNFGINYHNDGYDGCACFYFDGNSYNFSLYNDNGLVDVSNIAKQYGGGGHKGASGMRLNINQFLELIKK